MDAKIDYLSFTVMINCQGTEQGGADAQAAQQALALLHPNFWNLFASQVYWEPGSGRGHYGASRYNADTYAAVRFGGSANHILVELPGTACQWLKDHDALLPVLADAQERLTRLDIAVDVVTETTPQEFVAAGYGERWKAHASIISAEGSTEYVGSMKSERFARVYKYAPPHPRAGTLRIEHVLRGAYAKAGASDVLAAGVPNTAAECGLSWGWKHAEWQPGTISDCKLRAKRSDRHEPGRVRWLYDVVAPSLVKADAEGLIDLADFWRTVAAFKAARDAGGVSPGRAVQVTARSISKR